MTTEATACAACGDLPNEAAYARNHARRTPQGELVLCDRCSRIPMLEHAMGDVCTAHFDNRNTSMADKLCCGDCRAAVQRRHDRIQAENTIDPEQPYGQHIALTCRNHPELRWNTKNIGWIGARSIFYGGNPFDGSECPCSIRELVVVKP